MMQVNSRLMTPLGGGAAIRDTVIQRRKKLIWTEAIMVWHAHTISG